MTRKKFLYIVGGIAILVLGYFNYFAEEGEIKDIKKTIETTNAVYQSEDYYVEAEKEIDYIDEKESKFEKAKAKIKDMILTGDNAFLDKARNLILKSNIVGLSPKGWEINASELKYEKENGSLVSNEFVSMKNEKKGIEISGNYLKTNVTMDYIVLDKGVTIKNKVYSLTADKANYDAKTKEITLDGNIKIMGNTEENKEKISGTFNKLYYNIEEKNSYVSEGFDLSYEDIELSGRNIVLNDREESFLITEDIKIKYQDYIFSLDKIQKEKNSDIVKFYGEIKGNNEKYSLLADMGEYNIKNKKFKVSGNIYATSTDGEKLSADEMVYNTESKDIEVIGSENDKVKYSSKTNDVEGTYFIYNKESKTLKTDKEFFARNDKKQSIKGNNLTYNIENKDFEILNEVIFKDKDYLVKTGNINYNSVTSIFKVLDEFEINFINQNMKLKGNSLTYNKLTEDLKTKNPVKLYNNGTEISGKNLVYNNKTLLGKIEGLISIKNPEEKISGSAKEIVFKKDNYAKLVGSINIKKDRISIDTDTVNYLYEDKKFHSTSPVKFKDLEKNMLGEVTDFVYDPNKKEGMANNLKLKDPEKDIKSDKVFIYNNINILDLKGNVIFNSGLDKIRTNELTYNTQNNDIVFKSKTKVYYDNYEMDIDRGLLNKETGKISLKNTKMKTQLGDSFSAESIYGNFNAGLIHLKGNVKGQSKNKNGDITFSGEKADLYLEKNNGEYEAKKIIVNEKSIIKQLNKTVKADYIEVDLIKNIAYSKNRPKLFIDNGIKGNIQVEADEVDINFITKIANLRENIFAKSISKKDGKDKLVELRAKRGVVSENIVDVYENIKITDENSIIKADEGHYHIKENKVRAKGNVKIEYIKGAR